VTPDVSGISKGPLDYGNSGVLRRRLALGREGPRAVRAGVQRIHGRVVKRLIGMPLTFRVYYLLGFVLLLRSSRGEIS
jgi:hypothetical protein